MLIYQSVIFGGVPQGSWSTEIASSLNLTWTNKKSNGSKFVRCSPEFTISLEFNLHFGHPPTEKNSKKQRNTLQITKPPKIPIFSYKQIHSPPPQKKNKERPFTQSPANIKPKFFFDFFLVPQNPPAFDLKKKSSRSPTSKLVLKNEAIRFDRLQKIFGGSESGEKTAANHKKVDI